MANPHRSLVAAFALAAATLMASGASAQDAAPRAADPSKVTKLQEELASLKVQMEYLDLKVRDSRSHVRRLEEKIAVGEKRVSELSERLNVIASESTEVDGQILSQSGEVARLRERAESIMHRFSARLIQLHKIRQGTLLSTIFSANDLNSFLNRYQMVRYLLQGDRKLLVDLDQTKQRLDTLTRTLEEKKARLDELSGQTRKNQEELQVESSQLTAMLQTLVLERKLFLARQEKLKQSYASLENEIEKVESQRSGDPVAFDRTLEETPATPVVRPTKPPRPPGTTTKTGSGKETGTEIDPGNNFPAPPPAVIPGIGTKTRAGTGTGTGVTVNPGFKPVPTPVVPPVRPPEEGKVRFRWPLKTIGDLGLRPDRPDPAALDLVIKGDTEVQASAKGKVLFKGPMGQLGNVIILGHHQGYSSVYGRLDEMWVGLGQIIEAGDVLGLVNGMPDARLHFEIRLGGRARNPLSLLPPLQ